MSGITLAEWRQQQRAREQLDFERRVKARVDAMRAQATAEAERRRRIASEIAAIKRRRDL